MSTRLFTLRSIGRSANAARAPLRTSILRPISSTTYSFIQRSNQSNFNNIASFHTLIRLTNEEKTPSGETPTGEAASAANATATATAADPKMAELSEELKKKDAQIKDLQDKYTRALAEAQNTLTRSQKQIADAKQFAVQSFAKQLLEVADILEIATKAAEPHATASEDANFKNLYEGVTMTQKVLVSTFERNGLKKFEPLNEKFDPYFHDGILQMEDASKTPGTVGIVLKSGYKLHERCLRAAQVGTVKAPSNPTQ